MELRKRSRGFTLIELLVVISIIGLLSSVTIAALSPARGKARDALRRSQFRQIKTALELYYDSNGSYPVGGWWGTCADYQGKGTTGANGWIPNLAPNYMPVLPVDPRPVSTYGCYLYLSNGVDYKVLAHFTFEGSGCPPVPTTDAMYDPPRSPSQCTVSIYTPGAINW